MRIALLDARPAELHQEHHLDSARSLPYSIFNPVGKKGAQQLEGYALVVVYCDSPHDALARRLAGQLRSLGVSQVKVLENGAKALEKKAPPK
jgi:rhodanese-related sulfurtransferase